MFSLLASLLLASSIPPAPAFLGEKGSRAQLEQKFLSTPFCKTYGCVLKPRREFYSVFRLKNALEVWMDPCCQKARGLRFNLGKPHPLSETEMKMFRALIQTATGKAPFFDLALNCSSVEAIQNSNSVGFKISSPTSQAGEIRCVEDSVGIPKGQENTAPEWVPQYYFAVFLLG